MEKVSDSKSTSPADKSEPLQPESTYVGQRVGVCIVGGKQIVRTSIAQLLESRGLEIKASYRDEEDLAAALQGTDTEEQAYQVLLLILAGSSPFGTFHRTRDVLNDCGLTAPLVVLSDQASRGQVYTALRIGAKAYVNMDADPAELVKAIAMASRGKVYLASDATERLENDISSETEPAKGKLSTAGLQLSKRETEIVQLLCEGLSSKEIGRRLHISAKTVENHRYNIYRKSEVDSIAGLMRRAIQQGLISL